MLQQFNSMRELVEDLGATEERIKCLKEEKQKLRIVPIAQDNMDGNRIARGFSMSLPQTKLLHPNFLSRAFVVWGHFFIANLLIDKVVGIEYACLFMVLFGMAFINTVPR